MYFFGVSGEREGCAAMDGWMDGSELIESADADSGSGVSAMDHAPSERDEVRVPRTRTVAVECSIPEVGESDNDYFFNSAH